MHYERYETVIRSSEGKCIHKGDSIMCSTEFNLMQVLRSHLKREVSVAISNLIDIGQ